MISEGIARVLNGSAQGVLVDGVPKAGADVLTEALTNGGGPSRYSVVPTLGLNPIFRGVATAL